MGGRDEGNNTAKKPVNSFSLLQKKMSEVQKSKKPKDDKSSSSLKNNLYSRSSSKLISSSRTVSNANLKTCPPKEKVSDKKKIVTDPDAPDRSYGDFYCPICDSHMNSDAMWEAHIIGKRHQKNVKKGDPDPKYEHLDVESSIMYEIRNVKDPIVGLSYIHEIKKKEAWAAPTYTCYLCQANFASVPTTIDHVISMKHRMNYMKETSPDEFELLGATNLKKAHMEPLVNEEASKLEHKFGRGTVKVKQERMKQPSSTYQRKEYDDDDDMPKKLPKSQKFEDTKNTSIWKAVDYPKKESRKRPASDEEINSYKRHDYLKRPTYDSHSSRYETLEDSSKRESFYPRTSSRVSPEECYPRTSSRVSPEECYPRTSSRVSPEECYRRSRSPPRELVKQDTFRSAYASVDEHYSYPRSYQTQEQTSRNSENYPVSADTKVEKSDSDTLVLKDFVQKVYALQTDIFLKIVLLKLENMDFNNINDLSLLCKVIDKAQDVLRNKLPPEIAVLRQKMVPNSESTIQKSSVTPPVIPQVPVSSSLSSATENQYFKPASSHIQGSDFSFMKDFMNHSKVNDSSSSIQHSSQNIAPHQLPHQNTMPYQASAYGNLNASYPNGNTASSNVNYSYDSVPTGTSSIPGLTLTEENNVQPSYSSYQPHYPGPSSSYPPYGY